MKGSSWPSLCTKLRGTGGRPTVSRASHLSGFSYETRFYILCCTYFILLSIKWLIDILLSVISCSTFNIVIDKFEMKITNPFLFLSLSLLGSPLWLSLLGSRILFNMKEAAERGQNEGTSYSISSLTISDMNFADTEDHQRCVFFGVGLL